MGLFNKISEKRMKDPVEGTLRVVGINRPDPTATSANYHIDGVVSGPGFEPQAVSHHGMLSTGKWPTPGQDLPVLVDRANPKHFVIQKDQLATGREQAASAAQALAAQMRGEQQGTAGDPPAPAPPGGGPGLANAAPDGEALALAQQLAQQFGGSTSVTVNGVPVDPAGGLPASEAPPAQPQTVRAADILARGIAGHATVLGTYPSPMPGPAPDRTSMGLMLNVLVDGRPPYQVQNLYAVPTDKVGRLAAGALLPVKVDPSSDQLVAVDWDAW